MRKHERKTKDVPLVDIGNTPNFSKLIMGLVRRGYSRRQIADGMGCGRGKVYDIVSGRSEPTYTQGLYLLELLEIAGLSTNSVL